MTGRLLAVMLLGAGLVSCGLVPLPRPRKVPGVVKEVSVVEAETGRPLEQAVVRMGTRVQDSGWMNGMPILVTKVPNESLRQNFEAWSPLQVTRTGAGVFRPQSAVRTTYVRPWGLGPLGWAMYSEVQVGLLVMAPGRGEVMVHYSPSWCETPERFRKQLKSARGTEGAAAGLEMKDDGRLVVRVGAR